MAPAAGARGIVEVVDTGRSTIEAGIRGAVCTMEKVLADGPKGANGTALTSEENTDFPSGVCEAVTTLGGGSCVDDMTFSRCVKRPKVWINSM